ncbi:AraC family transcriptional regulator [Reyranella sp. CPCC 100927]|uniref:helix-turn-helix transcriptional regulator n=1 Tax=Reyranella sp. CPCC 100927 TaxID=2599616 RepID=UPI0015B3DC6F|nr:AraC family transcriptional regulator [Reyranella sp. CPCC 100927]
MDQGLPFLSRVSSETIPASVRVAYFREEFCRTAMKAEIVDCSGGAPHFDFTIRCFGPVRAGTVDRSPYEFTFRQQDQLSLHLIHRGTVHARQAGLDYSADPGACYVLDHTRACRTTSPQGERIRIRNIGVDPAALRGLVRRPHDATGLLHSRPTLHLLDHYLAGLETLEAAPEPALLHSIGVHLLDLFAAVLGPTSDAREVIAARGVQAARVQTVLAAMDRHFNQPLFTVGTLAAKLGVSRRYVHRLLERTGRTFSQHVLDRRLRYAHALLSDPHVASWRIIDIAGTAGFDDISYFNRQFRARFGETPTSVRCIIARAGAAPTGDIAARASTAAHHLKKAIFAPTLCDTSATRGTWGGPN